MWTQNLNKAIDKNDKNSCFLSQECKLINKAKKRLVPFPDKIHLLAKILEPPRDPAHLLHWPRPLMFASGVWYFLLVTQRWATEGAMKQPCTLKPSLVFHSQVTSLSKKLRDWLLLGNQLSKQTPNLFYFGIPLSYSLVETISHKLKKN